MHARTSPSGYEDATKIGTALELGFRHGRRGRSPAAGRCSRSRPREAPFIPTASAGGRPTKPARPTCLQDSAFAGTRRMLYVCAFVGSCFSLYVFYFLFLSYSVSIFYFFCSDLYYFIYLFFFTSMLPLHRDLKIKRQRDQSDSLDRTEIVLRCHVPKHQGSSHYN